jgi:hypothetical protein
MTVDSIDRTYIRRAVRARIALIIALVVLAGFAGFIAVGNVRGLAADVTATYTPTTGHVVSEGTDRVLEGSRRNKHWVEHRTITVEYDIAGDVGSDDVRSDTIQVGDTLDIWVRDQTGDVALESPDAPGFWQWLWAIVMPILTVLLAWGLVVAVRTSIRLSSFRPDGKPADFVFALQDISVKHTGRNGKKSVLHLAGILESSVNGKRVGERAQLVVAAKNAPTGPTYPPRIVGYRLTPGSEGGIVILHTPELEAWWVANLTFPADLEATPAGPQEPVSNS